MPQFHHVNLGVPVGGLPAQSAFLTEMLGYRSIDPGPELAAMGATWFEGEDGVQIHLSTDPDHRPAARAHVAVVFGDQLADIESRLSAGGHAPKVLREEPLRVVFCADPSGNRWELRSHV